MTAVDDAPVRKHSRKRAWAITLGVTVGIGLLSVIPLLVVGSADEGEREAERVRRNQQRRECEARLDVLASELRRYRDEIGYGRDLPSTLSGLRATGYWKGELEDIGCPACERLNSGGALGGYALVGGGAEGMVAAKFPRDEWIVVCDSVVHDRVVHIVNGELEVLAVPVKWAREQLAAQDAAAP